MLAGAARAGADSVSLPASERAAIRHVIEQQLEAFRRHDGAAAFAHAAPAIQEMFGTPERFMLMVEHEYPPTTGRAATPSGSSSWSAASSRRA